MTDITKSKIDKKKETENLLSDWLTDNSLMRCAVFNAKLTPRGCAAIKANSQYKLANLDYNNDQEIDYVFCTGSCTGLKLN